MNAQTKKELDLLIKTSEMMQEIIGAEITDAAMLATVVEMARDGNDEMALYMLHNFNPVALKVKAAAEEQDIDVLELLKALLN